MNRLTRVALWMCVVVAVSAVAWPAEAVRICQNVCTCSASCALTCRDDQFIPTTCGASIYDCIDKCIVFAPAAALGVAQPPAEASASVPQAGPDAPLACAPGDVN